MSESQSTQNVSAALAAIEAGIKAVRESGRYAEYLAFCAKFHKYSLGNQLLIWTQKPEAQMVAGYHRWLELDRYVRKGEKGIMILAPMVGRKIQAEEEELEAKPRPVFFKAAYVFDVSQTEGEPLPEFATELEGDDESGIWSKLSSIAASEHLAIDRAPGDSTANGYYSRSQSRIWVDPDLSPLQSAKTLAHELSHHFANHAESQERGEKEMIAESSAYIVMNHLGRRSDGYSFDYLASWGDDKLFRQALNEIIRTANTIIQKLEGIEPGNDPAGPATAATAPVEEPIPMAFRRRPEVRIDDAGMPIVTWPKVAEPAAVVAQEPKSFALTVAWTAGPGPLAGLRGPEVAAPLEAPVSKTVRVAPSLKMKTLAGRFFTPCQEHRPGGDASLLPERVRVDMIRRCADCKELTRLAVRNYAMSPQAIEGERRATASRLTKSYDQAPLVRFIREGSNAYQPVALAA